MSTGGGIGGGIGAVAVAVIVVLDGLESLLDDDRVGNRYEWTILVVALQSELLKARRAVLNDGAEILRGLVTMTNKF